MMMVVMYYYYQLLSCFFRFGFLRSLSRDFIFVLLHFPIGIFVLLVVFRTHVGRNNFVFGFFANVAWKGDIPLDTVGWMESACFTPIYSRVAIFATDEGPGLG